MSAPKTKPPVGLGQIAGRKAITFVVYPTFRFLAHIFGATFSFFEEWSYHLADRIEKWRYE